MATRMSPKQLADRERARKAAELRRDGMQWPQIADELGYSDKSSAYTAVRRFLDRNDSETADEYRELLTQRYEDLYARAIKKLDEAYRGREVGVAQLLSSARGILDSLAKLHGLQEPLKVETTVVQRDELDEEIANLVAQFKANASEQGIAMPTPVLDAIAGIGKVADSGEPSSE